MTCLALLFVVLLRFVGGFCFGGVLGLCFTSVDVLLFDEGFVLLFFGLFLRCFVCDVCCVKLGS